jgi:polysaccharide export outer membrane protein
MNSWSKAAIVILALVLTGGASTVSFRPAKGKHASPNQPPAAAAGEYVIGPDDLLVVNVWKEPEISRNVLVRPDGKISLPLVGDLPANGRTPVQLRDDIKQQLRGYLSDPEVTVIVQEARSRKFNILGEVEHPGSYSLSKSMTVLDAIALAGGFRDFAKTTKIFILRANPDGSHTRIPFSYKEAIRGTADDPNAELQPHDTIVVP